ncbi:hypothetical protein BC835DRAFT_203332 [Cytidiella melzeri]|nr:hypothetical protein BC835DRAFT_203332 [Cytidiella melzeri]
MLKNKPRRTALLDSDHQFAVAICKTWMSSVTRSTFLTLPNELLVSILAHLRNKDRVRCRSVNRRLKSVMDESIQLQVQSECELANVELNPFRRTAPLADVIKSLQERDEAWKTLRWTSSISVPVLQRGGESGLDANVQGRDCGILGQVTADNRLVFTQIPSKVRNIQERTWIVDGLPFAVTQFALDERQGLLAIAEAVFGKAVGLTEVKLHSLLLTSGAAHPLASGSISLAMPPSTLTTRLPACQMAIAGEFVGVMVQTSFLGHQSTLTSHFSLCNWRTGEVLLTLWCGSDDKVSRAANFGFLSPEYILIPRWRWTHRNHELMVIRTRGPPERETYSDTTRIVAVFDLPELKAGASSVDIRSLRPMAPSFSPAGDAALSGSDSMFLYTPKSQMLTFVVIYVGASDNLHIYRLYVPVTSFLNCLPPPSTSGSADNLTISEGIAHIPWQDWGEDVRVIPHKDTGARYPYSHTCFLWLEHIRLPPAPFPSTVDNQDLDDPPSFDALVKCDFPSVMQMRRESHSASSHDDSVNAESLPSSGLSLLQVEYHLGNEAVEVEENDLWTNPVYSAPYRRTVMKLDRPFPDRYLPCFISEDAVGVQDESSTTWRVFTI